MHNRDIFYIEQMLYYSHEALSFFAELNQSEEEFLKSKLYKNAISKSIEQIGEQLSEGRLSDEVKEKYAFIPWRLIKDFRNLAVHEYGRVDWTEVVSLLKTELNQLNTDLEYVLHDLKKKK